MAKGKKKNKTITEDAVVAEVEVTTEDEATTEPESVTEDPLAVETKVETEESAEDKVVTEQEVSAAEEKAAEEAEEPLNLEKQLELAQQEAAKNREGWQRAAAELANIKRRQEEQLKLQRDRIKGEVLEGVITALDDMDLAFQNVPEEISDQLVGWVEGFRLVQRKLNKVLDDQNVMPVNTEGDFDPNLHEAVSHEENDEHEEGQIIAELRKGYQIGNRVLRPALVRVAK